MDPDQTPDGGDCPHATPPPCPDPDAPGVLTPSEGETPNGEPLRASGGGDFDADPVPEPLPDDPLDDGSDDPDADPDAPPSKDTEPQGAKCFVDATGLAALAKMRPGRVRRLAAEGDPKPAGWLLHPSREAEPLFDAGKADRIAARLREK